MTLVRSLSATIALGIAGCASLPSPTETSGGILAFPMHPDNNTGQPYSFHYGFKVFEQETDLEVMEIDVRMSSGDFVDTYGPLPAGDYYLGTFQTKVDRQDNVRYNFNDSIVPIDIPFNIKEDTLTVLDTMMWVQIRASTSGWTTNRDLIALSPAVEAEALKELEGKNEGLGWAIQVK
ncbi:hypothetical protein [Saccharospirillum sp.]|uniref:hypothetical protein n=1 Tax=Saccharospirillum sp. TaxID=2033801 RepID=UPI0034A072CF